MPIPPKKPTTPTLAERAIEISSEKKRSPEKQVIINDEHIELAICFISGRISLADCSDVLGFVNSNSRVYTIIARSLKIAFEKGKIKI